MRLISAGSLVRAQSGPVFARVRSRERRLSRRSLGEGGRALASHPGAASYDSGSHSSISPFRTGNTRTARDLLQEKVRAPEMRKRMPGFEHPPAAMLADQ